MKEKKDRIITVLSILCGLLLLVSVWALFLRGSVSPFRQMTAIPIESDEPVEKHPGTIDFPCFERLRLKANTKKQTLALPNPAENVCYFRISLYLEDGTLLWESELIEPGYYSEPIRLQQKLPAGLYENAVLFYETFTMDGTLTPLNSGSAALLLEVN